MPFRPEYPGERPTLGWAMLDWYAENLIVPDGAADGEPLTFTQEQAEFILKLYEVDRHFEGQAIQGRTMRNGRLIRRAVLSRSKGWGKSPIVGAICLGEGLGDVVFDGWDANGRPVGRPWATMGFKPKIQIVAVSEDQTDNTWEPVLDMARRGPVLDNYSIDPMETFISIPRGRIERVTSSATSREGFRPVFSAMDQTESWTPTNGGVDLAAAIRRNLSKTGGASVETPNAFAPGLGSVAEHTFEAFQAQQEGRTRLDKGLLVDHREAPPETDPTDEDSLRSGLAVAYGESADIHGGWVDLDRKVAEYWDPDTDPQDARRYYLNQITHASDSWISQPEWKARHDATKVIADGDVITLGFDGSRKREDAVTDATGIIGTRVEDGHQFEIGVWEQPNGPEGKGWQVPDIEVDAAVDMAFDRWTVVGFFGDPAKWESWFATWEARHGKKLKVKASRDHPMQWWMTGGRATLIVRALKQYHSAVIDGDMSHDGSYAFTRHVLNARRRISRSGVQIAKAHPSSPNKIDLAVAGVLSWQARLDAVAAGAGQRKRSNRLYRH